MRNIEEGEPLATSSNSGNWSFKRLPAQLQLTSLINLQVDTFQRPGRTLDINLSHPKFRKIWFGKFHIYNRFTSQILWNFAPKLINNSSKSLSWSNGPNLLKRRPAASSAVLSQGTWWSPVPSSKRLHLAARSGETWSNNENNKKQIYNNNCYTTLKL